MSELLFRKIIYNVGKSSEIFINNFKKLIEKDGNIYVKTYNLPRIKILSYFVIFIFVFFILTKYNVTLSHILALFISLTIVFYMINKDETENTNFIENKKEQLEFLNNLLFYEKDKYTTNVIEKDFNIEPSLKKSYLYLNPLIIQFFYNVKEYSQYNLSNFRNSLTYVNNVLKLNYQMNAGVENPFDNYENVKIESNKALNAFQAIIFSLPSTTVTYDKFNASLKILHSLLEKYLQNMTTICEIYNSKNEYNIDSIPDSIINSTNKVSRNNMDSIDFSKHYDYF